jgi:type I restriction enzyme M protein
MFKPFTNTKTCVLFLQKRTEPLASIDEAKNDPKVVYAVTERPGKDKSGRLIRDKDGNIISDLPEIAAYIKKKATFLKA